MSRMVVSESQSTESERFFEIFYSNAFRTEGHKGNEDTTATCHVRGRLKHVRGIQAMWIGALKNERPLWVDAR